MMLQIKNVDKILLWFYMPKDTKIQIAERSNKIRQTMIHRFANRFTRRPKIAIIRD